MTRTRQRQTRPWLAWVWTLASIGLVVALIAATGGFADAPNARKSAELGASFDTGRRVWVVRSVELTDESPAGYTTEPSLLLNVTITNTDVSTDLSIDKGTVEVVLPDGSIIEDVPWRSRRNFGLQPDIPASIYAEIEVDPAKVLGKSVIVRVHTDELYDSVLTSETWRIGNDAVDVVAPVLDTRKER